MATYYWVSGNGTWDGTTKTNWSTSTGGAGGSGPPTSADTVIFDANSGTGTCTTASGSTCSIATLNSSNLGLTLGANHTMGGVFTLTLGTLALGSNTLTCLNFNSNNSNTRTLNYGTGKIVCTGNNLTVWNTFTSTNLTYSGTPRVELNYSGGTGTRIINVGGVSSSLAISFYITAGTDTIGTGVGNNNYQTLDFTGFSGTLNNDVKALYGNLILNSGMTVNAGTSAMSFISTSGTQKITTAGKTLDFPITQSGAGGTLQLQDNLTMGSTRTFTLTAGTLDLTGNSGNQTLTTGLFSSSNSNTRTILFGTGAITITGSGTVWNTGTVTNFSYTGTPTVNISNNSATATTVTTGALSAAQALNFNYTVGTYTLTDSSAVYNSLNFTGFTGTVPNSARTIYGNLTLASSATNSSGTNATTFAGTSGTQQITTNGVTLDYPLTFNGVGGTFAFQDALTQGSTRSFLITNGTVQLKASATSTVGSFATSGATQKYLQSTTAGTQATLSQASGTVSVNNLTIKDINAVGGAIWLALGSNGNVDGGNNTNWEFENFLAASVKFTRRKTKRYFL
jgi:hypothetical protein